MKVGDDRVLADYKQIASYFRALEASSPRVKVAVLGKTTLGEAIAAQLHWRFQEGDDHHPRANVEKMSRGEPLTDDVMKCQLKPMVRDDYEDTFTDEQRQRLQQAIPCG